VRTFYDKHAIRQLESKIIAEKLQPIPKDKLILDVGCGSGNITFKIAEMEALTKDLKIAAIEATTTTDELAAYITGLDYPVWSPDPDQPLPPVEEEEEVTEEPA